VQPLSTPPAGHPPPGYLPLGYAEALYQQSGYQQPWQGYGPAAPPEAAFAELFDTSTPEPAERSNPSLVTVLMAVALATLVITGSIVAYVVTQGGSSSNSASAQDSGVTSHDGGFLAGNPVAGPGGGSGNAGAGPRARIGQSECRTRGRYWRRRGCGARVRESERGTSR
jgi:hypothetical protein